MFGIGAAIVGMIGYAAFGIITGIEIGYISLAVGWLIGKAMRAGSKGIGGRRYQVVAVALTYAAVSMAAIPIYISLIRKEKAEKPAATKTAPANPGSSSGDVSGNDPASTPSETTTADKDEPKVSPFKALGLVVLLGLASPFLELQNPVSGVLGLVILFVGMRFAWQQTGAPKIDIVGPFQSGAPAATPAT